MKKMSLLISCICLLFLISCKPENNLSLKIISYNIRHGEGVDSVLDLSRSKSIINSELPDFCVLQEVDNYCLRSNRINQTSYLAKETNMTGTFAKFMEFQNGEYGMATLSAKPILSTKILQLPDAKYEPRVAIIQEVELVDDISIIIVNVHLDWLSDSAGIFNRLAQAKSLINYINQLKKPTIIAGDFNCTPNSQTMRYFAEEGFNFIDKGIDNLSFQGEEKMEIDHVIIRNTKKVRFKLKSIKLLEKYFISDHRPLVCELEVINE